MITTHVLDTALGRPAPGVLVTLQRHWDGPGWVKIGEGATDDDGRLRDIFPRDVMLEVGTYRLVFQTALYFAEIGLASFYPEVAVTFEVDDALRHYHVPLLLSPFGYSTYRGS